MIHYGDKYGEQERTRFARERMRTGNCEITRGVRIDRGEERVSGVASRFGKSESPCRYPEQVHIRAGSTG